MHGIRDLVPFVLLNDFREPTHALDGVVERCEVNLHPTNHGRGRGGDVHFRLSQMLHHCHSLQHIRPPPLVHSMDVVVVGRESHVVLHITLRLKGHKNQCSISTHTKTKTTGNQYCYCTIDCKNGNKQNILHFKYSDLLEMSVEGQYEPFHTAQPPFESVKCTSRDPGTPRLWGSMRAHLQLSPLSPHESHFP